MAKPCLLLHLTDLRWLEDMHIPPASLSSHVISCHLTHTNTAHQSKMSQGLGQYLPIVFAPVSHYTSSITNPGPFPPFVIAKFRSQTGFSILSHLSPLAPFWPIILLNDRNNRAKKKETGATSLPFPSPPCPADCILIISRVHGVLMDLLLTQTPHVK